MPKPIEYLIRRKEHDEQTKDIGRRTYGELVARIVCIDCHRTVCIAQCDGWPPHGPVTLHIGEDWDKPIISGDAVLCGECGGPTTTSDEP